MENLSKITYFNGNKVLLSKIQFIYLLDTVFETLIEYQIKVKLLDKLTHNNNNVY